MKMFFLALMVVFLVAGIARPQERWQADVQVRSVNVSESRSRLTCTVEVYSDSDDDARNTTVRILLPVGVKFVSSQNRCTASPSAAADGTQGVVTCNIGTLTVGASRRVRVVTTLPPAGFGKIFGAFAWSITPDPHPNNNYRESAAP